MLFYDRIDVSKGIDINKPNFRKGNIYYCSYVYRMNFNFQPNLCDGCNKF